MRTLRLGSKGEDVGKWQYFLRGVGLYFGEVDEAFGIATRDATQSFQRRHGLLEDGVVGNRTFGEAMRVGFAALEDEAPSGESLDIPPRPIFPPLNQRGREQHFGSYAPIPAPVDGDPEAIQIPGNWQADNIVTIEIPQLKGVRGANGNGNARFHRLAAPKVLALFTRWEEAGLTNLILSYAGSFVPRFIRGSRSVLSSHAHGSAFDINAEWNAFGAMPARQGAKGSVRLLVPIANELGFFWGGHFTRRDGMHFELARL